MRSGFGGDRRGDKGVAGQSAMTSQRDWALQNRLSHAPVVPSASCAGSARDEFAPDASESSIEDDESVAEGEAGAVTLWAARARCPERGPAGAKWLPGEGPVPVPVCPATRDAPSRVSISITGWRSVSGVAGGLGGVVVGGGGGGGGRVLACLVLLLLAVPCSPSSRLRFADARVFVKLLVDILCCVASAVGFLSPGTR